MATSEREWRSKIWMENEEMGQMEPIAKEMECQADKKVQRTWKNTYFFVGKGEN